MNNFSMKLSSTSIHTSFNKVNIILKTLLLTQDCTGHANKEVISARLGNKSIVCRHLAINFLTLINGIKSLSEKYKTINKIEALDTGNFNSFIALYCNQGEMNIIRKYVFISLNHVIPMMMKNTDYNTGWIIGYDPNSTFECMICHIKPINDSAQWQCSIENPWKKIKRFISLH